MAFVFEEDPPESRFVFEDDIKAEEVVGSKPKPSSSSPLGVVETADTLDKMSKGAKPRNEKEAVEMINAPFGAMGIMERLGSEKPEPGWLEAIGKSASLIVPGAIKAVGGIIRGAEEASPASLASSPAHLASIALSPLKYVGLPEAEQFMKKVAETIENKAPAKLREQYVGGVEELVGVKPGIVGKSVFGYGKKLEKEWSPAVRPGSAKAQVSGAVQSAALNLPMIVAAIVTKKPNLALEAMGAVSGGEQYGEMRDQGQSPGSSMAGAAGYRKIEIATEKLPLKFLTKEGYSIPKRIIFSQIAEQPGEFLATTLQNGVIDIATTRPETTWGEYKQAIVDTAIQTAIATPFLASAAHPMVKWATGQQAKTVNAIVSEGYLRDLSGDELTALGKNVENLVEIRPRDKKLKESLGVIQKEANKRAAVNSGILEPSELVKNLQELQKQPVATETALPIGQIPDQILTDLTQTADLPSALDIQGKFKAAGFQDPRLDDLIGKLQTPVITTVDLLTNLQNHIATQGMEGPAYEAKKAAILAKGDITPDDLNKVIVEAYGRSTRSGGGIIEDLPAPILPTQAQEGTPGLETPVPFPPSGEPGVPSSKSLKSSLIPRVLPNESGVGMKVEYSIDGEVVGSGQLRGDDITNIIVEEPYRRLGIGTEIIQDLMKRGGKSGYAGTEAGIGLMGKAGMVDLGGGRYGVIAEQVAPGPTKPKKTTKPFQAKTLISWVKSQGGIWDESLPGETKQFIGKESGVIGLLSKKTGRSFDELAALAKDYGWIGPDATAKDFIDLLTKDVEAAKQGKERVSSLHQNVEKGVLRELSKDEADIGEAADDLIKAGWKVFGTGHEEMVGNISKGDRILSDGEGYTHVGWGEDGKAILKDGETLRLDVFDKIPVEAMKEKGTKDVKPEPAKVVSTEPESLDLFGKPIRTEIPKITYEEFEKQYQDAFDNMKKYTPEQVGMNHYADQMAKLADDYPEHLEKFEAKLEAEAVKPKPVFGQLPPRKPVQGGLDFSGQQSIEIPKAPEPESVKGSIGKNPKGFELSEDENGVRTYVEKGVTVTEPVNIIPTRQGLKTGVDVSSRSDSFKTIEEIGVKSVEQLAPDSEPEPLDFPAKWDSMGYGGRQDIANSSIFGSMRKVVHRLSGSKWAEISSGEREELIKAAGIGEVTEQPSAPEPGLSKSSSISDWVKSQLDVGKSFTKQDLFAQADSVFGGTMAQGKYNAKDAFDALEMGINRFILNQKIDPATDSHFALSYIDGIRKQIMDKIPSQSGIRSAEQDEFQQFSTPPDLAYTIAWAANLNLSDIVLEPSAGIGGIAVFAKNAGAKTIVNELSSRRAEILKQMGFDQVFTENAEQINNILPKDVKPTVVLMNPPFSATAGRIEGQRSSVNVVKHLDQAFKRLEDGGRLVALIGKGRFPDPKSVTDFLNKIVDNYNVRANIIVSGQGYAKYGTTYDNRILVFDKTSPDGIKTVEGQVEDVKDAIPLLKEVRDGRTYQGERVPAKPEGEGISVKGEGSTESNVPIRPATGDLGTGKRGPGDRLPGGRKPETDVRVEPKTGDETSGGTLPEPAPGIFQPPERPQEAGGAGLVDPGQDPGLVSPKPGIEPVAGDGLKVSKKAEGKQEPREELTDSIYETYQPQKLDIKDAKPHPGKLVESAAMSVVEPPDPTYSPKLPDKIIKKGLISGAQLEAVVYAGQAHQQTLPTGERRGFFIGDGTGVGKGREIAAILWDNWNQGRHKGLWISQNNPLFSDARRDVKGIDWDPLKVFDMGTKVPLSKRDPITGELSLQDIKAKEGILFLGYDRLKTDKKVGDVSRLNQIVNWLGEDFDGVIVFDEAHNMGNALAVRGTRGTTKPSAKALAGVELQRRLPNARVVYVSATGATEVKNFSYADRLGLWGEGTSFANKSDFVSQISSGGMASMELVARDMKAMGNYIARSLSYEDVKYEHLSHPLTESQRYIYNELADSWHYVLGQMNSAMQVTNQAQSGQAVGRAMSQFWGAELRFFEQIVTSMQMPTILKSIDTDLKNGHSAIVQLVNTNQASQERAISRMEEEDEIEDLDMTPRDQLMEYIRNNFPIHEFEPTSDADGNIIYVLATDSQGNPIENAEAIQMRDDLLTKLGSLKVPDGPLEMLLNHFGTKQVAEITGRTRRVVYVEDEKGKHKAIENRSKSKVESDVKAYIDDKKKILVFSYAGGTGATYNASLEFKNQRLRRHYLAQAGWRADRAFQGFGRSHRTNQKQAPEYVLCSTDVIGQKRFISSIARRLDQMGSLTRGQREAGSGGFYTSRDNLESTYALDALHRLIQDVYMGSVPDISMADLMDKTGLRNLIDKDGNLNVSNLPGMTQFLNRLLAMRLEDQDVFFNHFSNRLDQNIRRAMEKGTLDVGLETLRAKKIKKVQEQVVHTDERSGAQTKYVELEVTKDNILLPFNKLTSTQTAGGFVKNKKSGQIWSVGQTNTVTDTHTGELKTVRTLRNPNYSTNTVNIDVLTPDKYEVVETKEAKEQWNKELEALPLEVNFKEHLITGAILPIWDRLEGHARIMRVQTDEGERMLGRLIDHRSLQTTLQRLGANATQSEVSPKDLHAHVINSGFTVQLSNGWEIKRRKVQGENRIEIKGPDYRHNDELTRQGAFLDRINYETRYFIPTTDEGIETIKRIIANRPVVNMIAPANVREDMGQGKPEQYTTAPTFYSKMERFLDAKLPATGTPETFKSLIESWGNKGEFKADELKWSGLVPFLEGKKNPNMVVEQAKDGLWDVFDKVHGDIYKGSLKTKEEALAAFKKEQQVTKQDILDFLKENQVEIKEVVKGGLSQRAVELRKKMDEELATIERSVNPDYTKYDRTRNKYELLIAKEQREPTKFHSYQLPGGQNYREVLLTLPSPNSEFDWDKALQPGRTKSETFRSAHWPNEPNVFAHIRMNDRTDAEGNKVLFLEEIQSDWALKGRQDGFTPNPEEFRFEEIKDRNGVRYAAYIGNTQYSEFFPTKEEAIKSSQKIHTPPFPFAKNWEQVVLKRMLRYAAENGYSKLAWINGQETADRYDLSKQVDSIDYYKNNNNEYQITIHPKSGEKFAKFLKEDELSGVIGKELAGKIISGEGENRGNAITDGGKFTVKSLSGLDLKIGGEWAYNLYDKMVPQFLGKYGKAWGAKVEEAKIKTGNAPQKVIDQYADQPDHPFTKTQNRIFQSIPITPSMVESVLVQGQPLFATGTQQATSLVGLSDVEKAFPGQKVYKEKDGYRIETKGNQSFTIKEVDFIDDNTVAFEMAYERRRANNEVIAGSYKGGRIRLTRGAANQWVLAHESFHLIEDFFLTPGEIASLSGHVKRMIREGKMETVQPKNKGGAEDRANFIADELTNPKAKGTVGRIIAKIREWIDRLINAFGKRTVAGIVRDVKSGKIFERGGDLGVGEERFAAKKTLADGRIKEEIKNPNNLNFTEKEQHRIDQVKERFDIDDMPPITIVGGKDIIDGHNRVVIAKEAGINIKTISIDKKLFNELKEKGFDEIEISHAMLEDRGYYQEAKYLDDQFPGAGVEKEGNRVLDIIEQNRGNAEQFTTVKKPDITAQFDKWLENFVEEKTRPDTNKEAEEEVKVFKEIIKDTKVLYGLGFNTKDISQIRAAVDLPWWIAKDYPAIYNLVKREMKRSGERNILIKEFLESPTKKRAGEFHEFLDLPRKKSEELFKKAIVPSDAKNKFMTAKELDVLGMDESQKVAYYAYQRTMDKVWRKTMDHTQEMVIRPYKDEPWFDLLRDVVKGNLEPEEAMQALNNPDQAEGFEKALKKLDKPVSRLKELRSEYKKLKFYSPRVREQGEYVVVVRDETGKEIYLEKTKESIFSGRQKHAAEKLAERLVKNYPANYQVIADFKQATSEDIYQQVHDLAIERFVLKVGDKLKRGSGVKISEEDRLTIVDTLLGSIADELNARGFKRSSIHRVGGPDNVIKGYKEENGKDIFYNYITGMAGGLAKQDAAFDYYSMLSDMNQANVPNRTYNYGQRYVQDMLRNSSNLDRISGKIRSIAFTWYIAGRISAAAVNFSQNYVAGIPYLARRLKEMGVNYALKSEVVYHKAMVDVTFHRYSGEEKQFIQDIIDDGAAQAQFNNEAKAKLSNKFGGTYDKTVEVLSLPFAWMEIFNRKSAGLAMFRELKKAGKSYEEAKSGAEDFINDVHYLMGKSNLPQFARGEGVGSVAARTLMTFRSFNYNYVSSMINSIERGKGWRQKVDVFGRSFAYLVLFGGLGSLPFLDDGLDLLERLTGVPYRSKMRRVMKGLGGQILEKFGHAGLPGILGVDISGSLKMGIPLYGSKEGEFLAISDSVYGVYGGMTKKIVDGTQALLDLNVGKAFEKAGPLFVENIFKAGKGYVSGVTTGRGRTKFDEQGKPLMLSEAEAAKQAIGFRSERVSRIDQERRSATNSIAYFKNERDKAYQHFRDNKGSLDAIRKERLQYNRNRLESNLKDEIPEMTLESLNRQRRAMRHPSKKEKGILRELRD